MLLSNPHVGIIHASSAVRQNIAKALAIQDISIFYDAGQPPSELPKSPKIDVWILSASTRRSATYFAGKCCLILDDFLPIPSMFTDGFDAWYQRFWKSFNETLHASTSQRQVELTQPAYSVSAVQQVNKIRPLPIVAVVGASMGGPEAVQAFLQALTPHPELRVILAHHGISQLLQTASNPFTHHTNWQCQYIQQGTQLAAGIVYLAPERQQIAILASGIVTIVDKDWTGAYHPSIDEVYTRCSHVFGSSLISITLSGMMDDGSRGVRRVANNGGLVWVQSSESAAAISQIDHVNATGLTSYSGTPAELAQKLLYVVQNSTRERRVSDNGQTRK